MNITTKMIITDTNIITDLSNAKILEKFVNLDNVYISDLILNDEIHSSTGEFEIIKKFKVIEADNIQIKEIYAIKEDHSKLSTYDILNYIIARDNNAILATGDQKLKTFSEDNNVEVIRTLKIIKLMKINKIISNQEAIKACTLLIENESTRIPKDDIESLINEFEKDAVTN